MKLFSYLVLVLLSAFPTALFAASFHWVDTDGFHSVDQVTKVPLKHRLDLPMVKNRTALPFTEEEDKDGSMYVWFVLNQSGISVPYIQASELPNSSVYGSVDQPEAGDIAWWKGFVAIAPKTDAKIFTAKGEKSRKALEKTYGKVTWYRYKITTGTVKTKPSKAAPQKALKSAGAWLARLDKTAEYPLQVKDRAEIERLKKEWQMAITDMESLRKSYPDDPQVTRIIGVLYRRGFTLEMPGAWDRAEAYLLRTTTLAPKSAEAFISLGILYGDTGEGLESQAETPFRKALKLARKDQLPHIWWGLSISLLTQEKFKEALNASDRLLKLRPNDPKAKDLRTKILEAERKHSLK